MKSFQQIYSVSLNFFFKKTLKLHLKLIYAPIFINLYIKRFISKFIHSFLVQIWLKRVECVIHFIFFFKLSFHLTWEIFELFDQDSLTLLIKCLQQVLKNEIAQFFIIFRCYFFSILIRVLSEETNSLCGYRLSFLSKIFNYLSFRLMN